MNYNATETQLQYDHRKCRESLADAQTTHRIVRALLERAKRAKDESSIPEFKTFLQNSRKKMNVLSSRRTRMTKRLQSIAPTK